MLFSNYSKVLLFMIFLLISSKKNESNNFEEHPCSNDIVISATIFQPDCFGKDGTITFINPPPAVGTTFEWSHDPNLTGHQADNLDAGIYTVIVRVGSSVRQVKFHLE